MSDSASAALCWKSSWRLALILQTKLHMYLYTQPRCVAILLSTRRQICSKIHAWRTRYLHGGLGITQWISANRRSLELSLHRGVRGEAATAPKVLRMLPHRFPPGDTPELRNDPSCVSRPGLTRSGTDVSLSPGGSRSRISPPYRRASCSMFAHPATKICISGGN